MLVGVHTSSGLPILCLLISKQPRNIKQYLVSTPRRRKSHPYPTHPLYGLPSPHLSNGTQGVPSAEQASVPGHLPAEEISPRNAGQPGIHGLATPRRHPPRGSETHGQGPRLRHAASSLPHRSGPERARSTPAKAGGHSTGMRSRFGGRRRGERNRTTMHPPPFRECRTGGREPSGWPSARDQPSNGFTTLPWMSVRR